MSDDQVQHDLSSTGHSLGEMLRAAREARGAQLAEISRQTAVRADYLEALEEGRHDDLPEPVYVRNFVRLYAQALGLDPRIALEMYVSEVSGGPQQPQAEPVATARRRPAAAAAAAPTATAGSPREKSRPAPDRPRGAGVGTWLPSVLLIVLVVGLAVWGFNSSLFRPGVRTAQAPDAPTVADVPQPEEEPAGEPLPAGASSVRLSVTTEPAGARVLVDSFPIERLTPFSNAPVTARDSRLIRIELDGYEPFEAPFDLTFDRNLSFVLQEAVPVETAGDETEAAEQAATSAAGTITVTVSDESWLEIYPGTARDGTPHVYTTAAPGQSWNFDLPVYIRVGNAAGVSVSVNGRDLGALGSAGEITGRAFTVAD